MQKKKNNLRNSSRFNVIATKIARFTIDFDSKVRQDQNKRKKNCLDWQKIIQDSNKTLALSFADSNNENFMLIVLYV